jgi:hypothetical protein
MLNKQEDGAFYALMPFQVTANKESHFNDENSFLFIVY